jgi:hypothetical protein
MGYRQYGGAGRARAIQHIREHDELRQQLGGALDDVEDLFFALSKRRLELVLNEYEQKHNKNSAQYVRETMPKWKSGHTKMSGQTASRLFDILPRHMTPKERIGLVESLWKRQPGTVTQVTAKKGTTLSELKVELRDGLTRNLVAYTIPDEIRRRFDWLYSEETEKQQDLLNAFLVEERKSVETEIGSIAEEFFPLILGQANNTSSQLKHTRMVGRHSVVLTMGDRPSEPVYTGCLVILGVVIPLWVMAIAS